MLPLPTAVPPPLKVLTNAQPPQKVATDGSARPLVGFTRSLRSITHLHQKRPNNCAGIEPTSLEGLVVRTAAGFGISKPSRGSSANEPPSQWTKEVAQWQMKGVEVPVNLRRLFRRRPAMKPFSWDLKPIIAWAQTSGNRG
jgi:hypothetical protein